MSSVSAFMRSWLLGSWFLGSQSSAPCPCFRLCPFYLCSNFDLLRTIQIAKFCWLRNFLDSLDNYYPSLSQQNLGMSGYRSNTTFTRILYLKMVSNLVILFSKYFVCSFMIDSHLIKRQKVLLNRLFRYCDRLFLTLVEKMGCCVFCLIYETMQIWFFIYLETARLLRTIG